MRLVLNKILSCRHPSHGMSKILSSEYMFGLYSSQWLQGISSAPEHFPSKCEIKVNPQITIRNNDRTNQSPLVFIFGWGNGRKKNLLKYSEIFEKKNFTTVLVTSTLLNSLFRTSTAGRKESENVKQVLADLLKENKDREIVFYPFSNGGCAIYHMMTDSFDSSTFPGQNVRGEIFDSCPIVPNQESASAVSKAFSGVINIRFLEPVISMFAKMMVFVAVNKNKDVKYFMEKMRNSNLTSPQLFLFSKDDDLAPYQDIIDFISARQDKGIKTQHRLWEKSQHCGHLRNHPEEYIELVNKFIDENLHAK